MPERSPQVIYVVGAIVALLIGGSVVLSALGRPLTDILILVSVAVMPVLGLLLANQNAKIEKNTNGVNNNNQELIKEMISLMPFVQLPAGHPFLNGRATHQLDPSHNERDEDHLTPVPGGQHDSHDRPR